MCEIIFNSKYVVALVTIKTLLLTILQVFLAFLSMLLRINQEEVFRRKHSKHSPLGQSFRQGNSYKLG